MQWIWIVMLLLQTGCSASFTQELDWSSKDWDGTKAKTKGETNLLMDWNMPKPQINTDQKMDANELALSKLQIEWCDPKEEPVDMTDSLIPLLTTKALEEMAEKNESSELSEAQK